MKNKIFGVLILLFISFANRAQVYNGGNWPNDPFTFPNNLYLNTGANAIPTSAVSSNLQTLYGPDYRWEVQVAPNSWVKASVVPDMPSLSWSPSLSYPPCRWITTTGTGGGFGCQPPYGNWADYSCIYGPAGIVTRDYRIQFTLPTYSFSSASGLISPSYHINWQLFADDKVTDIWVNSIHAVSGNTFGDQNNAFNFRWCSDWKQGLNTIVVRVRSSIPQNGNSNALMVISWPQGPAYSISGPTVVCPGASNQYNISPSSVGNPALWTRPVGWLSTPAPISNSVITTNGSDILKASSNSGLVQVTLRNSAGTCLGAAQITVTVPPPITVTSNTPSICQNGQAILTANFPNPAGGTGYVWYLPPSIFPYKFGQSITESPLTTTTYSVSGLNNLGGCKFGAQITLPVKPNPVFNVTGSPNPVCAGQPVTIQAIGPNNVTYNTTWPPGNSSNSSIFATTPAINTIYTVKGTSTNGCSTIKTVPITVNPLPAVTAVANPVAVCPGVGSVLTANGGVSYAWTPAAGNTPVVNVNPAITTNYQVTGTGANGCQKSANVTVNVLTTPVVTVVPPLICPGLPNTLTASGATPGSYTWTVGGSSPATYNNVNSITLNVTNTTPYTVCGTAANGCVACANGVLTPGTPFNLSANSLTLCTNVATCTNISVSSAMPGPVTYVWSSSSLPAPVTGSVLNICPTSPNTIYNISATSPSACPSNTLLSVKVVTNCCPQSTVGTTALSAIGGTYTNGSYVLMTPVQITTNTAFQFSEVLMGPDAKIIVPPGMQLDLDKAHFFSCGLGMWQGIQVQDGGRITTDPTATRFRNSLIEDAEVAIDLDGISLTNTAPNPPIDIQRVIFNKNYIGIKISNSDPMLDSLALGINGCVFSSHNMPFSTFPSTVLTWPSSNMNAIVGGLRAQTIGTPTTGLVPPYTMNGFAQSNLKSPHNLQPAHIGIKIENVGNQQGTNAAPGVQFGNTWTYITNDFNLFDGVGKGIEVTDASLTTRNNVFQNSRYYPTANGWFGGVGIDHTVTGFMNARLSLKGGIDNTDGNHFWNCNYGIKASNVYELWVRFSIFRSTHQVNTANFALGSVPGDVGILNETNRFDFTVQESEFNNVRKGISFATPNVPAMYDLFGSGITQGVYAKGIDIERNYFGPEVLSTNAYTITGLPNTTDYMSDAMEFTSPTPPINPWFNSGQRSYIVSNKVNRSFRGLWLDGLEDMPLHVSGNLMLIEDDNTYGTPAFGYGIGVQNKQDHLVITTNTLEAMSSLPPNNVSLVYCNNNFGFNSPLVECNSVTKSNYGFQFNGLNQGTSWKGNVMCENWAGLALTNGGEIGQQGNSTAGCSNVWSTWCGVLWNSFLAPNQTYCDNSDATLSPLYVVNTPACNPSSNGSNPFPTLPLYSMGPSASIYLASANAYNDCVGINPYIAVPNWRSANSNTIIAAEALNQGVDNISIYPNPSNGLISIAGLSEGQKAFIKIIDLRGAIVSQRMIQGPVAQMDLSELNTGVYFIELKFENNKRFYKKLIKTN